MGNPSIFRDPAGNIRQTPALKLLANAANVSVALGSAAAASCTLQASTGNRWVIEAMQVCLASVAANTAVIATLSDGTNTLWSGAISANGVYNLIDQSLSKVSVIGPSATGVGLQLSSPGTGGTVTAVLIGSKVVAADA